MGVLLAGVALWAAGVWTGYYIGQTVQQRRQTGQEVERLHRLAQGSEDITVTGYGPYWLDDNGARVRQEPRQ